MKPPVKLVYELLIDLYGPQHWWPAESDFEMILGAVLTQNTNWANVDKALKNLRANNALNLQKLADVSVSRLAEWIRPAGYFNQKAMRIKEMIQLIHDRFDSSLDELFKLETQPLRKELLSWKGVGPETADCILLYAAKRPVFVVDAYTRRMCLRHDWIRRNCSYDDVAQLFTDNLTVDTQLFNEYHALIVQLCKDYCNTQPKCDECPLKPLLP